jgi:anti-sigma regulatory factor (Ser/Thr protein kinase)
VPRCERRFPAHAEHVSDARRQVLEVARETGAPDAALDGVRLAVSEAVANAVQHGYRDGRSGEVTVLAEADHERLKVVVTDEGCGMSAHPGGNGAGLGLPLIAELTDSMSVRPARGGRGTTLCMTFHLPVGTAA